MDTHDNELLPKAAAELRRYEGLFKRAEAEARDAEEALAIARSKLEMAEGALNAARHVFGAAMVDRRALISLEGLSERKVAWLRGLLHHDVFTLAQAGRAAEDAGWKASVESIRQEVGRARTRGLVVRLSQGAFRLAADARRLLSVSSDAIEKPGDEGAADAERLGVTAEAAAAETERAFKRGDLVPLATTENRDDAETPTRRSPPEILEEDDDLPV